MSLQNKAILLQKDILKNFKELDNKEVIGDVMLKICEWRLNGNEPKKDYPYYIFYMTVRNSIISGDEAYDERVNKLKEYRKNKTKEKTTTHDIKEEKHTNYEEQEESLSKEEIEKRKMFASNAEQKRLQKILQRGY